MDFKSLFRRKSIPAILEDLRQTEADPAKRLVKNLTVRDLVAFGIAAIIGSGIYSSLGDAVYSGGPAVSLLYVFTAIACLFSALCYAEFASTIPVSGSAYTYSYVTFGEIIAWIIGWNLLMEYAIGNSVVAFSWSEYFSSVLNGFGVDIPNWLETDYLSCRQAAEQAQLASADPATLQASQALVAIWNEAPKLGGLRIILDAPALVLNLLITWLVYVGIKESKRAGNLMVVLKIAVVLLVVVVGAFYVKPENWTPFAPEGMKGVLGAIAGVFFAYIGFDAISTTAEECKNPQRDLPKATVYTLIVCTILYVLVSLVATGMLSYKQLKVADPLAFIFDERGLDWMAGIISVSAVVVLASVFLVFQLGQPRIWMSMSRDGLLPKPFAKIHPRHKTPSFATIVTCIVVALPILFLNMKMVLDLSSIGTLFAFMLVSAGILVLDRNRQNVAKSTFRVPYFNGKFVVPALFALCLVFMPQMPDNHNLLSGIAAEKMPYLVFFLTFGVLSVYSFLKNWSLIPVLGVLTNLYLIAGLGHSNWMRFIVWCAIGFLIYFFYSYQNSRLAKR